MDNQSAIAQPGVVSLEPPSTVLNPETVSLTSGGGVPALNESAGDEGSVESVLEGELARLRSEDGKADKEAADDKDEKPVKDEAKDEKPAKDAKADEKPAKSRAEDGKFAKAEKVEATAEGEKDEPEKAVTAQETKADERQSEGRKLPEPPARFLPKEKEAWGNVPNVVKSAIARVTADHDAEVTQYKTSHEEWGKLAKFDQMAKQHNSSVSEALERYTALDGLLANNPIEAIRQIMATRGITPEQYANHVLSNPDAHRAPAPQAAPDPVVHQMNNKVQQLEQTIESMRYEQAAATIIEPFRAEHPRYDELQDDIAFFLQSGKIPASLTPHDKLEAAYDMATRINPTSEVIPSQASGAPAAKSAASPAKLDAGTKSIRGAPSDGADSAVEEADDDLNELLRKQLRRISA